MSTLQTPAEPKKLDSKVLALRRENQIRRWVELLSAVVLSLATVATAWSGYQSSLWNGAESEHLTAASAANIKTAKYTNLAEQKYSLHTSLFGQWAVAENSNDRALAGWLFKRFPEPLKAASVAWVATMPLTNPDAPATPFDMPEYALPEAAEIGRWEGVAATEAEAAGAASEVADRYLLFTIIFASVLFFGGISGKFRWLAIDIAMLAFGVVTLVVGLGVLLWSPVM